MSARLHQNSHIICQSSNSGDFLLHGQDLGSGRMLRVAYVDDFSLIFVVELDPETGALVV